MKFLLKKEKTWTGTLKRQKERKNLKKVMNYSFMKIFISRPHFIKSFFHSFVHSCGKLGWYRSGYDLGGLAVLS